MVLSLLLPINSWEFPRERRLQEVKDWLCRWCQRRKFRFLDYNLKHKNDNLWARNVAHVSSTGKHKFVKKCSNLIKINGAGDLDTG